MPLVIAAADNSSAVAVADIKRGTILHSSLSFNPLILRSFTASLIMSSLFLYSRKISDRNRQRYNNALWQMPFSKRNNKKSDWSCFQHQCAHHQHGNIFLAYTVKIKNITDNIWEEPVPENTVSPADRLIVQSTSTLFFRIANRKQ